MPFVLKKYTSLKGEKIQTFMIKKLRLSPKFSQTLISKGRVFDDKHKPIKIGEIIKSDIIYLAVFEGSTRGLKPIFQTKDFAIFDKPTNLMVHPINKKTTYSLLDEVRYHFGENANLVHRIDAETSGLIMCAKNKDAEIALKVMFQEKKYKKSYLTIVNGKLQSSVKIDGKIDKERKNIGVRMAISKEGKESLTVINPIKYNEKENLSLVEAIPITGRQHQIRIHLHSIGHTIYGDPIYGVDDEFANDYLNKDTTDEIRVEKTKSNRLWLHANYLEFEYKGTIYKLYSKNKEIFEKFDSML